MRYGDKNLGPSPATEDVPAGNALEGETDSGDGRFGRSRRGGARALVAHGASVVGAARDLEKAKRATSEVSKAAAKTGGGFELLELDLASLKSVRSATDKLVADGRLFDVIIANAGVMATPFGKTQDGFETQFGTNHLGHFVFVNRIAKLIKDGGRLVNLASSGHRFSDVDLNDPNFETTPYEPFLAYGRSKTANILFAIAFDQQHRLSAGSARQPYIQEAYRPSLHATWFRCKWNRWSNGLMKRSQQQGKEPFEGGTVERGPHLSVGSGRRARRRGRRTVLR